jgi:hypothetical protein
MSFKFNTKEDVATKKGDETLVRKNGIARLVGKAKRNAQKVSK